MERRNFPDVTELSLRARLALALRLFQGYCDVLKLTHPEIDRLVDYLWEYVQNFGDGDWFQNWASREPELINVALGDSYPFEFEKSLRTAGVDTAEFRRVIDLTTEVVYGSMYGNAHEKSSKEMLYQLAEIVVPLGVNWPDVNRFKVSRWTAVNGFGSRPSPSLVAEWRN